MRRFRFAVPLSIPMLLFAGPALSTSVEPPVPVSPVDTRPSSVPPRDLTPRSNAQAASLSAADLRRIEARVGEMLPELMAATVGIARNVGGQGSGVIVREDGLVLTAGHVSGAPDQDVFVILSDGRRVRAKTLGRNRSDDSGMIQILEPGPFPFVEVDDSDSLSRGDWVIALGHPGGWRRDRPAVLRLGRVSRIQSYIISDAVLVGGDSGGPLFDLQGRVVGIHSRIGNSTSANMHVPLAKFRPVWDRLASGDDWSNERESVVRSATPAVWLGLHLEPADTPGGVRVTQVEQTGPAAEAGVMAGDVIARLNGRAIEAPEQVRDALRRMRVGETVKLEVIRDGGDVATVEVKLARRPAE